LSSRVNAARTLEAIAACNSLGRSAKVELTWIALMSRSKVLGTPPDAALSALRPSTIEE
jgi:hypothetical protein